MIIDFEETVNPLGSSLKNRMSSKGSGRPVQPKMSDEMDIEEMGQDSDEELRFKAEPVDGDLLKPEDDQTQSLDTGKL